MPILLLSISPENLAGLALGGGLLIGVIIFIYIFAPRTESPEEFDQRHFRSNTKSYLAECKNNLKSYQPPKELK